MEVKTNENMKYIGLIVAEIVLLSIIALYLPNSVYAGVGEDNVTLLTLMDIGNSFPQVDNITINNNNPIDLVPNATTDVVIEIFITDYNGEDDISNVTGEFFDSVLSNYGSNDDLNTHYTNSSCIVDKSYGDGLQASANCTISLQYFANNQTWNFTVAVNDSLNSIGYGSELQTVNTLLAFELPGTINYGLVNATSVSEEIRANVTNFGNVEVNLSLSGYGSEIGDGNAMNCSLGAVKNISIYYEKFNLTDSNTSIVSLSELEDLYENLTTTVEVKDFGLLHRQNDTAPYIDDTNTTYWRIYVPEGVAGNCSGNIVFGATQATGT